MSKRRSNCRRATRHGHSTLGFTLLELILSLVLMSVLLTTTWMLMGAFQQRLERSQTQAEERQLIRSVQRTLEEDLWSVQRQAVVGQRTDGSDAQQSGLAFNIAEESSVTPEDGPGSRTTDPSADNPLDLGTPDNFPSTGLDPLENSDADLPLDSPSPATSLASEVDQVVMSAWLLPTSFFLGTSQELMFDRLPSAEVEAPPSALTPPMDPLLAGEETAAIPDSIRRVVYAFSSPRSALISNRPVGLVRCELTMRQLTSIQTTAVESDLLLLIRNELPDLIDDTSGVATDDALDPREGDLSEGTINSSSSSLANELANAAGSLDPTQPPLDLGRSLDYVPEIVTFSLRYHDGSSWSSNYDSRRHQGKMPVAVELRFQLQSDLPKPAEGDDTTDPLQDGTDPESASPLDQLNETGALESTDNSLRSALTKPPEDHRYVILLRRPEQRPATPNESFSEPDESGVSTDEGEGER